MVFSAVITAILPTHYMDETFHVFQFFRTVEYLHSGKWEWDPAITTFPGLYFVSVPFFLGLSPFLPAISVLRGVNGILMNFILLWSSDSIYTVMYPLNLFYSFLYYTDSGSTALVVLTSVLIRNRKKYFLSGLSALLAVAMRQTNIVWVFGFCLQECLDRYSVKSKSVRRSDLIELVKDFWIHILLGIGFIFFFIANNFSIVLGHHEHHSVSLHFAQVNYFVLTIVGAQGPSEWLSIARASVTNPRWRRMGLLFVLSVIASQIGTVAHPFILSDNRHYSFYFYRYFISHRLIRSVLIPILVSVSLSQRPMGGWIFWMCTLLTTVPSPLIEFRYFNIPATFVLMKEGNKTSTQFFFVLVNLITMYVFLFHPFQWMDGSLARFMY